MKRFILTFCVIFALAVPAFAQQRMSRQARTSQPPKAVQQPKTVQSPGEVQQPKDATPITAKLNAEVLKQLPFDDTQDFTDANRGFIAKDPDLIVTGSNGLTIWDMKSYDFINDKPAPTSVNPSLWRVAQINNIYGLFKLTDDVYQVRGYDLSNMTIIEEDDGIIVIDPLISTETAKRGIELYYKHRPKKPVLAVIYTHSHIDHYGGVHGIVGEDFNPATSNIQIVAPIHFMKEAVSENIWAGNAMSRRSQYGYGYFLTRSEKGQVDCGLGKNTSAGGEVGLVSPTQIISEDGPFKIKGVKLEIIALMVPGTEAPAEFIFYFPKYKALCAAEDATHTLHNLYTLRGAQVRNAVNWWKGLDQCITTFGDDVEVIFAQHHWPMWGNENINKYLAKQRNVYKFIHDRTLHLTNQGYTMLEIGDMVKLPPGLDKVWSVRGYYGSVSHNAKAVYQRYLGWYDSNPANLHPLPPEPAAKKFVEYMGGADAVIAKAKKDFAAGEYRWVAQVMNQVVFADPNNQEAKNLCADALEQLGYQAENGTWRNEYLGGAYELRNGKFKNPGGTTTASPETMAATSVDMLLDFAGIMLDSDKLAGKTLTIQWELPDVKEKHEISLEDSVLIHRSVEQFKGKADVTVKMDKATLNKLLTGKAKWDDEVKAGRVSLTGDVDALKACLACLVMFTPDFNIVTP